MKPRFEIWDTHIHLFTRSIVESWRKKRAAQDPKVQEAAQRNHDRHMTKANNLQWEFPEDGDDAAKRWLAELDRAGVARGAFMAPFAESAQLRTMLSHSDRFIGLSWMNPTVPDAPQILERERAAGLVGVKCYPVSEGYLLSDKRAYPFYEAASRLGMFVLIHYGVTVGYNANLAFANPLDLHPVARDFPDVNFVIAHFGAGYMRECLMLAYQQENVHFDTSGSNNWLRTQPTKMTLKNVFERFLEGAGAERILYGSDSTNFPRGYRVNVLEEQLNILEELDISDAERALILGGNLKRLMSNNQPVGDSVTPETTRSVFG
ncbi:MAG: amidohydrolase [Armatimonadetes bacterium]|nr:amidohydrolase [Armatimonadota bacterium]